MQNTVAVTRYNSVAVFMHWLIALAIVSMLAIGWIMTNLDKGDPNKFALFQLHKSIGITILLLSVLRLFWRLMNRVPALPNTLKVWEKCAARATHWLFYILIIGMPLTGWIMISTSKHNIPTLLYGLIPWPNLPKLGDLPNKQGINGLTEDTHGILAYVMAALIVLHVGAAMKHHFINRDDVLIRMAPKFMSKLLKCIGGPQTLGIYVLIFALGFALPTHAADWTVDYANSKLSFVGKQENSSFEGEFKKFQTTINFDAAHLDTSMITATIDIASITAGSSERDAYLPQSDWFDTKKFPQAVFTSTKIYQAAQTQSACKEPLHFYTADGTLTIKSVTKPVSLNFCLTHEGDHMRADGALTLLRNDFNIGIGQWAADDLVAHQVDVKVSITAKAP